MKAEGWTGQLGKRVGERSLVGGNWERVMVGG